jgi:MFS family permease
MSNMLAFMAQVEAHAGMPVLLTERKMTPNGQGETYRERDLPLYLGARFLCEAAALAQSVAIGWTIYSLSNTPMALGVVALAQFVPMILLTLPAGELCDRFSPRRVLAAGLALQSLCASALLVLAMSPSPAPWQFYAVIVGFGAARAFADPAGQALLPFLVPSERLPRAIAWSSSAWQVAIIAGPVLGGLAYALGPAAAYGMCGAGFVSSLLGVVALGGRRPDPPASATVKERMTRMTEGLAFVWSQRVVLGAISLDLFAVLLGGATILLPVYARDILHAGPTGLGLMRCAPAVGACLIALIQARRPPDRRVGVKLFAAVAVFGIATLVFAFSASLALSLTALFVLGASDMVSVNIRSSLVQLATPDAMRGRVSAINMLFVGASSELGSFESGVVAALIGTVPAVALGGLATLVVAAVWMKAFPELRRMNHLSPITPSDDAAMRDRAFLPGSTPAAAQ